jgi:hypothetical protein
LIPQPDAFYGANAYVVVLVLVGLLAWPLAKWQMRAQVENRRS